MFFLLTQSLYIPYLNQSIMRLPKQYDPKDVEPKWQKYWEEKGIFKFDKKSKAKIYSIDTPPPTGSAVNEVKL